MQNWLVSKESQPPWCFLPTRFSSNFSEIARHSQNNPYQILCKSARIASLQANHHRIHKSLTTRIHNHQNTQKSILCHSNGIYLIRTVSPKACPKMIRNAGRVPIPRSETHKEKSRREKQKFSTGTGMFFTTFRFSYPIYNAYYLTWIIGQIKVTAANLTPFPVAHPRFLWFGKSNFCHIETHTISLFAGKPLWRLIAVALPH